jgi:hypothetical protein
MKSKTGLLALLLVLWCGCHHSGPQRPTQRLGSAPEPDSAQLALLELNQRLAAAADRELAQVIQTQDEAYALYDLNTWMHIYDAGDENTPSPVQDDEWIIRMRTYNLAGQLLIDTEGTYRIGRHELPPAVDTNIRDLHHGARVRLYVPWYAAYGLTGTEHVGPYENVIIEIELR